MEPRLQPRRGKEQMEAEASAPAHRRTTDGMWNEGIGTATADVVFDLEAASPEVFGALRDSAPGVVPAIARLRAGIPLMASSVPGEQGELYRLKGHNRSVCVAIGEDKSTSDVVVLKGTEPLMADFDSYIAWMARTQFGAWPRPLAEHFPLFEGKAPGTVHLAEAMGEATIALDAQQRHLAHYGGLMRLPVPLFVWKLCASQAAAVVATLRARVSAMAFERLEPHLTHGIGVLAYYYPSPPVRVHAAGRPGYMKPAPLDLGSHANVIERAIPGWFTIAARLLWLGLLPTTPLSWRLGDVFDPNNACLDGGVCDISSLHAITPETTDAFFLRSMVMSVGGLRAVVARAFGVPLGEMAQSYEQEVASFYLGEYVKRSIERALDAEARPTLTLDPRLGDIFGPDKSLPDLMRLFQTFNSYLGTTDYAG